MSTPNDIDEFIHDREEGKTLEDVYDEVFNRYRKANNHKGTCKTEAIKAVALAAQAAKIDVERIMTSACEERGTWYIGAMNDALFIINRPPRPSTDDIWPDRPDGPTLILKTYPLSAESVQEIVDAHNHIIYTLQAQVEVLKRVILK
jgi:hypothetical protein